MLIRRAANAGCELSWMLHSLVSGVIFFFKRKFAPDSAMKSSPFFLARTRLAEDRIILRDKLQRHPYWAHGHTRLGICELELELTNEGPRSQRTLGAIRTSALAARELCSDSPKKGRVLLEADYLMAVLEFLNKNYAAALEGLNALLVPETASQLTAETYYHALEHAGSSALVLGRNKEAKEYFSKIPQRLRNETQFSARRYFEALEQAD